MVVIKNKMSLEDANKALKEHKEIYRSKIVQRIIISLFCCVLAGMIVFFFSLETQNYFSKSRDSIDQELSYLFSGLLASLVATLGFITFLGNTPRLNEKYSTRVKLVELVPLIKEALDVRYLTCFTLEYTLLDDPDEKIQCLRLDGYSIIQSRKVDKVAIDVDNFLILEPWKGREYV